MKIIACVDDRMGMLFNERRVSSDRMVTGDILSMTSRSRLFVHSSTWPLLEKSGEDGCNIIVTDNYPVKAEKEDYCLIEKWNVRQHQETIDSIILYRWNRNYPSDKKFDIDLSQWKLKSSEDFSGYSHEKITKEIYVR